MRDPDRFEAMDALFQEFLSHAGVVMPEDPSYLEAQQAYNGHLEHAQSMRNEIASLEEQKELLRRKLDRGDGFFNKFLNSTDPADLRAGLSDVELRMKHQQYKLEEVGPQIDAAKQ